MFDDLLHDLVSMNGTTLVTHGLAHCADQPSCCIHNPSQHHMTTWAQVWVPTRKQVFRCCEHGLLHPDPDALLYFLRTHHPTEAFDVFLHPCDGCCQVNPASFYNTKEIAS